MVTVTSGLTTKFHQQLASPEWVARLGSHLTRTLESYGAYQTSSGTGIVFSECNEDRYMGPNSLCKYFFRVDALVKRGDGTLDLDRYQPWNRRRVRGSDGPGVAPQEQLADRGSGQHPRARGTLAQRF